MGTLSSLHSFFRKAPTEPEAEGKGITLPPDIFSLPQVETPPLNLMLTAGQAQAVYDGTKTRTEADTAITEHHKECIQAVITKTAEIVSGEKQLKESQKTNLEADLTRINSEIASGTLGEEVEVESAKPKILPDWVELLLTALASAGLVVWSVYTNHAFLHGSAVYSNMAAWMAAFGPILIAWVMKFLLTASPSEKTRNILKASYVMLTCIAAIAWVATFGHEAGSSTAALGDLTAPTVTEDQSIRMMIRGLAQLLIEIFGGSILFYRTMELLRNEGAGKGKKMAWRVNEKYSHLCRSRDEKRALLQRIEQHLGMIDKWFQNVPHIEKTYVTRALGMLETNIATLKGI